MNETLTNYTYFFKDQIHEMLAEYRRLLRAPIKQLIENDQVYYATVHGISEERGHVVFRFDKGNAPRLKVQRSFVLIKRSARERWGESPRSWNCSFEEFLCKEEFHSSSSYVLPLYHLGGNDPQGAIVGCSSVGSRMFRKIKGALAEGIKLHVLMFESEPPTRYLANLVDYIEKNPDDEKLYANTQEVLGEYYREHPQIHSCQIETTNRCNERCIHCYIPHELKNVVLPYEVIECVLNQLHDLGVMGLTLSGGEFFMHPDAEKILRKARELDFSFYVLSNITLLTPHMIEVLKEVNPSYVQTSLYSVVPEEHDHITQLKGSCEKTKAAIDALIAANIHVQISCPVMKTNYHTYKDVLKFAYDRKCKAQTDFVMMARYDFTTDNLAERLTMEQTAELLKDIIQFDKDYLE